jgi:transcriptional regulator with XRE-family HTH domain
MTRFEISTQPGDAMRAMADKVKALRKQRKYSAQELARRSGVSYGSVKRFESTGEISFESLLKIAYVFNRLEDFENVLAVQEDPERIKKLFNRE